MFDFLYRGPKGRNDIIKTTVEEEGEKYLESIYMLKNSFMYRFLRNVLIQLQPTPMSILPNFV